MNCARRLFNFLLQRKARIVQPTLIDEIKGAIRLQGPDHRRNCVDNKPNTIFDPFQIFDVDGRSIPIDNVSQLVSQRHGAN